MPDRAGPASPPPLDLGPILMDSRTSIVVTCGSGGVGKTTTAAAMALWAADAGRNVAVLTIDPAKRLAQSLGLHELDNDPRRVDVPLASPDGQLWAMMLDTRRTFDEMVSQHSTPERAKAILANPFYQVISTSFSGTQEYMAMEKLANLAATGQFDLIVVDTPPSRSALDFLDAPQRLSSFMDGRMIKLLATPSRGLMKIVGAGFALFSRAEVAATKLARSAPLTAAVLEIHAQRLAVRSAELHMRARFDRVHSDLPVVEVPALPSDAHDVPALREIGGRLTGA